MLSSRCGNLTKYTKQKSDYADRVKNFFRSLERGFKMGGRGEGGNGTYAE